MSDSPHDLYHRSVHGLHFEKPGEAPEIWCYTDQITYAPGDVVRLHVSTSEKRFDLRISQDGLAGTAVFQRDGIPGYRRDTPEDCSVVGCGWPVTLELPIGADWSSGVYRVTCRIAGRCP